jgi:para-nitrobenzyl esterase
LNINAASALERETPSGVVVGAEGPNETVVWRGVPYAAPPVGELRWRAPRPARPWADERDSTVRAAPAPQILSFSSDVPGGGREGDLVGSEDCLYLTIWSPQAVRPAGGRAVLVWLHGGGNISGDGNEIDASRLALAEDIVVICVAHRLGLLGWFAHGALAGRDGSDLDRSGNFGTLDQIAALRWVKGAIAAFGGDPGRVTIAGQSSGGWNVRALLCSPLAEGLFHRAIIQSVGSYQLTSLAHGENFIDDTPAGHPQSSYEILRALWLGDGRAADPESARELLRRMSVDMLAHDLRAQPVAALFKAARSARRRNATTRSAEAMTTYAARSPPLLFNDGLVVSDSLKSAVPVMIGATKYEDRASVSSNPAYVKSLFGTPVIRDPARYALFHDYLSSLFWGFGVHDVAEQFRIAGQPIYAYRFDWDDVVSPPGQDLSSLVGACHGMELPFLFGTTALTRDIVAMRHLFDCETRAFRKLSRAMMSCWGSFIRSGVPEISACSQPWTRWDGDGFMVFDDRPGHGVRMETGSQGSAEAITALAAMAARLDPSVVATLVQDLRSHATCRLSAADFARIVQGTLPGA